MQLQTNQPDLSQMFGQESLYNTLYGLQRQAQANQNQGQNLGQAQQEQQFQAQDQPYNLQQLAANVGHTQALTGLTNAQIPGEQARGVLSTNQADADTAAGPDVRRQAALSKYVQGISAADADAHEKQAMSDLFGKDPVKRQQAQMVLDNLPAIRGELRKVAAQGANELGVAKENSRSREAIDANDVDAGKYNKYNMEYLKFAANAKANFQQQAGIARQEGSQYQSMADQATNPEEKSFYLSKVDQAKKDYDNAVLNDYRAKQAAGTAANAAKVDTNTMGIPTVVQQGSLPTPPVSILPDTTTTVKAPPKMGSTVTHGGKTYKFKGGDPSNQSNWEQQ